MSQQYLKKFKIPLLLLGVCLLAYLPLSSFQFALKNDAFIYNFPNKHFFSESLRHGFVPLWNPYLNYGFPIFADPGFAWWHPITWLFGLIGYNAYSFTLEVLLYIYIGGLGMYWLGNVLGLLKSTSFVIACMFMCSGFFIGNLQHINFLTCAAFLPWLIGSWLLYQQEPNFKYGIKFGIFVYLLYTGGHPAIPIATTFFLLLITFVYFGVFYRAKHIRNFILQQIQLLLIACLFLIPLILSYLYILPFYSRSIPVIQSVSLHTGFTLTSYISFLFPFATIKNDSFFLTDVSMRNGYFSLLGFFAFLIFIVNKQKNKIQIVFLLMGLIMLILSFGGNFKEGLYSTIPPFTFIKTNGEFRVFGIFSFIICGAFTLNKLFLRENSFISLFKKIFTAALFIISPSLLIILFFADVSIQSELFETNSLKEQLKIFIQNLTFHQTLIISLSVFIFLCLLYRIVLAKSKNFKYLIIVFIFDCTVNSWLLLGITGVGKDNVKTIQNIIAKSPSGFQNPELQSLNDRVILSEEELRLIGNWSWYDKRIIHPVIGYPSKLINTERFFASADTLTPKLHSFAFFKHQEKKEIELINFSPSAFIFRIDIQKTDTLIILQNALPGWHVSINGLRTSPPQSYFMTFLAVPINPSTKEVSLNYCPF